jgi:c-di-GMP-binding flagellar brake protein YcgR
MDKEVIEKFNNIGNDMLKQISNVTLPSSYYMQNRKHYRIKAILDGYNFINNEISKILKQNEEFNPSMLYFSLLAMWFKELNKESKSKEYIYFILFPYANVYDNFLIEIKDKDFKLLNIKMIELAEKIIYKFDKYSF